MAVEKRIGCDACAEDAPPLSDVYHVYLHVILRRIDDASVAHSKAMDDLEFERKCIWDELLDMERQRDDALEKLERLTT